MKTSLSSPNSNNRLDGEFQGLLVIGDPHIEGRQPGFRSDNYPEVILGKVEWCLRHAQEQQLLPVFLGDLFDKPRDNPTWILGRLIDMLTRTPAIGIFGNHDCAETSLNDHDSLSILIKAGCFRLVSAAEPWYGIINERKVFVAGSSYREPIPQSYKPPKTPKRNLFEPPPLVVWLTHHDIDIAGYENGRFKPHEIENVRLLINGHIHRRLETVTAGITQWMTPGNISRRSRSEACRDHVPRVIRIDVFDEKHEVTDIEIPHRPFDEVFFAPLAEIPLAENSASEFVTGLAELTARRTDGGAGLHAFLAENLCQFEPAVAMQIKNLARQVTGEVASESESAVSFDGSIVAQEVKQSVETRPAVDEQRSSNAPPPHTAFQQPRPLIIPTDKTDSATSLNSEGTSNAQ